MAFPKIRRRSAQAGFDFLKNLATARMRADAEKLEQVRETTLRDQRHFQFQKEILTRVDVNRMNPRRPVQEHVEDVASRARDGHQLAVLPDPEKRAIDARILPSRIVNKPVAMQCREQALVEP